ncbi:UPF0431 protein C1orf66-like protein [Elysia marginata]|uniref:UPF0431 protein C1orf66-like protein n=1 Tax=Elysia marginata TaxID=1093978 RepID=A0AAV4GW86_9GAST|nr:UPF0431 protein C1orf66-like protein [Elysia marginata]
MAQNSLEKTVEDTFSFLKEFDWIHSVQVTKIFDGTLHQIPSEWLPCLTELNTQELNNLPFLGEASVQMYPTWPASLHEFLSVASRLSLPRDQVDLQPVSVDAGMARGMSKKKLHEVSYMASLVDEVVAEANCDLIVDVGSGLGYLDHVLHQVYQHSVLGLETVDSHVTGAETRAATQGLQCGVKSVKFNLTNSATCFEQFEALLAKAASSLVCRSKNLVKSQATSVDSEAATKPESEMRTARCSLPCVCLVGLHCCGDLSPTMLAVFNQVASVQAVCFVSCCYHKMRCVSGEYNSFPLSHRCREVSTHLKKENPPYLIPPQTLRLGAQETRNRWKDQTEKDHLDHMHHVAYRGLLELADCCQAAAQRKLVRKCDFSSFEAFLCSFFSSSFFSQADISSGTSILRDLHTKYKDDFRLIEVFTALQTVLQPVIESFIYNDRLLWLMEQGHSNVKVVPVFSETISPRNLALVVIK